MPEGCAAPFTGRLNARQVHRTQATLPAIGNEAGHRGRISPASGLYFYDETGAITEPLFAAVMKQLGVQPATKAEGLRALQQAGWLLVDATYEPVNALSASGRDAVIVRDYPLLHDDLKALAPERVVLIKKNVCVLLEPRLMAAGFRVLNAGRAVYFPSHGQQGHFHRQFAEIALVS